MVELKKGERLDNLMVSGLQIIQKPSGFLFGTDAVLLADFAREKAKGQLLDLCCGSGVIPLLLSENPQIKALVGLEYFEEIADMARRSIRQNNREDRIKIITGDVKNYRELIFHHHFDGVTVNPPYRPWKAGMMNPDMQKAAARHEVLCTLKDCIKAARWALKFGGSLFMVHRADRLSDVIFSMKENQIEPKRLQLVQTVAGEKPKLLLIEGKKGGQSHLEVLPPLILNDIRRD